MRCVYVIDCSTPTMREVLPPARSLPHTPGRTPFLQHGAVDAFDFAVGLRMVWEGAFELHLYSQRVIGRVGSVAGPIIGQHLLDRDSHRVKARVGAVRIQLRFLFLISQDLDIGPPLMVLHHLVQVVVAGPAVGRWPVPALVAH